MSVWLMINAGYISEVWRMFQWSQNERMNRISKYPALNIFQDHLRNYVYVFSKIDIEDYYFLIMLAFSSFAAFDCHSTSDSLNWIALDFKSKKSGVLCRIIWIAEMI